MNTIRPVRIVVEMASRGCSIEEIEKVTGIPGAALHIIIKSPLAQGEIARLQYAA